MKLAGLKVSARERSAGRPGPQCVANTTRSEFSNPSAHLGLLRAGTSRAPFYVAFTLIELLVVISIIGMLAGLAVPVLHNFKPNVVDAANRQLLDDLARARQFAISQRTIVYMVFVPTNFWSDAAYPAGDTNGAKLFDKQLIAYNFLTTRRLGDQPGQGLPQYLGPWKTLPEGIYIPPEKFQARTTGNPFMIITNNLTGMPMRIFGFNTTNNLPFPSADNATNYVRGRIYTKVPYIAFNYLGQLTSPQNEYIPLTKGSVLFQRDPKNGAGTQTVPSIRETPAGTITNAYNVISIDSLTGRAHLERQQVQ